MDLGLRDKVALLTGAGSGMGRASARLFATEGARIMVADLNAAGAEETVRLIRADGGEAAAVTGDVSQRADAERYVAATLERYDRLDVLVNNAGLEAFHTLVDTSDEAWERMFGVNAKGPYMVTQASVPELEKGGEGAIVNIASGAALRGSVGLAAYSAAKAALVSMTRCLARELGPMSIRVNAIAPGLIDTPTARRWIDQLGSMEHALALVDHSLVIKRAGTAEEVAALVVFLASPAASYITGAVLPVDGGMNA
jgi:NAD(P)-dependent dehydrogenase (short-subunit alcohol dehydrogenase family)